MARSAETHTAGRISHAAHRMALGALLLWPLLCGYSRTGADIAVGFIAFAYLFHLVAMRQWQEFRHPLWIVILALGAWLTFVVTPLAHNDASVLESSGVWWMNFPVLFTTISGLWWMRFPGAYLAISCWVLREERHRRWALVSGIVALGLIMADCWTQKATGHSWFGHPLHEGLRLTGPLSHPNAGMMVAKLGFAFAGAAAVAVLARLHGREKHAFRLAALWLLMALSAAALVLISGERMPAVLMLVALFASGAYLALRQPRWRWALLGGFTVALGLTLAIYLLSPFVQMRAALLAEQVGNFWNTEYGQLYRAAWYFWTQHPWQGIGLRHFDPYCPGLIASGLIEKCNAHPHNIALEWLAEAGIGGFIGYLGLVLAASIPLWRHLRATAMERLPAIASLLGLWVLCFFPFVATQSNFNGWSAGLTWLGFGLATAFLRREADEAR